jgi:hypothetical protein
VGKLAMDLLMIMITLSWQIEYVHCKIAAIVS